MHNSSRLAFDNERVNSSTPNKEPITMAPARRRVFLDVNHNLVDVDIDSLSSSSHKTETG